MGEPIIEVRGVSKDFILPHLRAKTLKGHVINLVRGRRTMEVQHALRDIDFDVARGEFFGVVGRNGSGKSTLLKILAGIYQPTAGHSSVKGRLVPFIELGVGFNPELTGRENVYLNGALLGFSTREVDEMYEDIVAFAELEGFMDQKLKNYSSGMHVRIAFSVATRARADILLIDEVLAVGDAAFQRKCFEHFRALKKSSTTIVFVTHDMTTVREFCDRAILLEDSRLVAQGTAAAVAEKYLRLFATPARAPEPKTDSEKAGEDSPVLRWGEGDLRYTTVRVPEIVSDQREIVIQCEAVAEHDVDDPVFGFTIVNSSGAPVLGTNSRLKKQLLGGLKQGEHVLVEWTVPNVFSDGSHVVELAIVDPPGVTVYDWWKEAASFTVVKEEKTPYIVTPETSLSIERVSG
jgi:ABC-2 type transport system ATP-binding protein